MTPKPGWLQRQIAQTAIDAATWPKWMRINISDSYLTLDHRKAAAKLLRERADELDPPTKES